MTSITNAQFAKNKMFMRCCELAKVKPTLRQASKWFSQKGQAYNLGRLLLKEELKEELEKNDN
jgi:hypothetical protein